MAKDDPKIYLPRMRTRPGQSHSYQGANVVVVDDKGRTAPGGEDPSVITTEKKPSKPKADASL